MISASQRLWRTSPLTYVALVLAALLSIYPFYYMLVIGSRSLDNINDVPPPLTPAERSVTTSGGCSTTTPPTSSPA